MQKQLNYGMISMLFYNRVLIYYNIFVHRYSIYNKVLIIIPKYLINQANVLKKKNCFNIFQFYKIN